MSESLNPSVRELLSQRVQNSIRDRGVDVTEMWKAETSRPHSEMTDAEKKKLNLKRLKNREHAKQSRERKNMSHATTEEKNRVMALQLTMLQYIIGMYYKKLHGREMNWRDITVECLVTLNTQNLQSSRCHCVPFSVQLPEDISERLPSPCKFEDFHCLAQELSSHDDKTGSGNERSRSSSTGVAIDIPSARQATSTLCHQGSYETINPSSYDSVSDHDFLMEESSCGSQRSDYCFSLPQASAERAGVSDGADSVSRVVSMSTHPATKGFTVKEEMDEEGHSPWMVTSGRENEPLKLWFKKRGDEPKNSFPLVKDLQEKKTFSVPQSNATRQETPKVSFSFGSEKKTAIFASPMKNNKISLATQTRNTNLEQMKPLAVTQKIGPPTHTRNINFEEMKPLAVTQWSLCELNSDMINGNSQMFVKNENVHCQENAMGDATAFSDFQMTLPINESSMDTSIGLTDNDQPFSCISNTEVGGSEEMFNPQLSQFDSLRGFEGQASGIRGHTNVENQNFGDPNGILLSGPPSTLSSLNIGPCGIDDADVEAILPTFILNNVLTMS